jgi:hypothetical protein
MGITTLRIQAHRKNTCTLPRNLIALHPISFSGLVHIYNVAPLGAETYQNFDDGDGMSLWNVG